MCLIFNSSRGKNLKTFLYPLNNNALCAVFYYCGIHLSFCFAKYGSNRVCWNSPSGMCLMRYKGGFSIKIEKMSDVSHFLCDTWVDYTAWWACISYSPHVSFSSCQRNLIKTFQIEGIIALIKKMDLIFSWDLLNGQK